MGAGWVAMPAALCSIPPRREVFIRPMESAKLTIEGAGENLGKSNRHGGFLGLFAEFKKIS